MTSSLACQKPRQMIFPKMAARFNAILLWPCVVRELSQRIAPRRRDREEVHWDRSEPHDAPISTAFGSLDPAYGFPSRLVRRERGRHGGADVEAHSGLLKYPPSPLAVTPHLIVGVNRLARRELVARQSAMEVSSVH